jgi:octaprenyl-diphosphate synthase
MLKVSSIDAVAADLRQVEDILHAMAQSATAPLSSIILHLLDAGGKRIRPTVTLLMGRMVNAPEKPLLQLAAAMEITHTATLIHDDLLDHAETRRGQSALHVHQSTGVAVLTGDYLFAQAARMVATANCPPLVEQFATMVTVLAQGEVVQLTSRHSIPTLPDYQQRIYAKTAAMFEAACVCAALLAGAPDEVLAGSGMYGRELGNAFQIMDDLLDFSDRTEAIGKPVQRDIAMGIFTLPVLFYQRDHPNDPDLAAMLETARTDSSHPIFDEATVQRLVHSIRKSTCLEEAARQAEHHGRLAARSLELFPASPFRSALEQLSEEASHRQF